MKKFAIILFVVLLATSIGIAYSAEPKKTAPAGVKVAPKGIDAFGSIKVLYPNGGEIWEKGKQYTIRWESKGGSGNVKIMLKWGHGSGGWYKVSESAVNSGSYNYTVPKTGIGQEGGQFKIYIITSDESIKDASDRPFSIETRATLAKDVPKALPMIKVIYPNGGETWVTGSKYTVKWTSQALGGNVKIMLKWGTGSEGWYPLTDSTPNTGSYQYKIPEIGIGRQGNQFKIYVLSKDGSVQDASDRQFTITSKVSLGGQEIMNTADKVTTNAKTLKQEFAEFRVAGQKGMSKERQGSLLESMGRTAQSLLNQLQSLNQQIARLDPGSLPQAEARRIRDRLDEVEKAIEESEWQRMHDEAEQGKGAFEGHNQKAKDLMKMMIGILKDIKEAQTTVIGNITEGSGRGSTGGGPGGGSGSGPPTKVK